MPNLASILTFAYLFFGLIITIIFVMASYNMYAKGYRPRFILFVIGGIAALTIINFIAATSSIQSLASAIENNINSSTGNPTPRSVNPSSAGNGGGNFF